MLYDRVSRGTYRAVDGLGTAMEPDEEPKRGLFRVSRGFAGLSEGPAGQG